MIDVDDVMHRAKTTGKVARKKIRKTAQYIGEGIAFLILIGAGAIFVFRAINRQFKQSAATGKFNDGNYP